MAFAEELLGHLRPANGQTRGLPFHPGTGVQMRLAQICSNRFQRNGEPLCSGSWPGLLEIEIVLAPKRQFSIYWVLATARQQIFWGRAVGGKVGNTICGDFIEFISLFVTWRPKGRIYRSPTQVKKSFAICHAGETIGVSGGGRQGGDPAMRSSKRATILGVPFCAEVIHLSGIPETISAVSDTARRFDPPGRGAPCPVAKACGPSRICLA